MMVVVVVVVVVMVMVMMERRDTGGWQSLMNRPKSRWWVDYLVDSKVPAM